MLRHAIVAMASLGLAMGAFWNAALAHQRGLSPAETLSLFRADPQIAVARNELRLASPTLRLPDVAGEIERDARVALAAAPLNTSAMRQLGIVAAARSGNEAGGLAQYRAAERITRRDLATQYRLINIAARADDVAGTLVHYNRAMLAHEDAAALLFPGLAGGLTIDRIRAELAKYATSAWFPAFLGEALHFGAEPRALVALMAETTPGVNREEAETRWARLTGQLVDAGQFDPARQAASRAPAAVSQALATFGFAPATLDPRLGGLAWRLPDNAGAASGIAAGGGLAIEMDGDRLATLAERDTLLAPGAYALTQGLAFEDGIAKVAIGWEMRCIGADGDLGETLLATAPAAMAGRAVIASHIVVPAGCPAQRWRIVGRSDETQSTARATLSGPDLRRL